MGSNSPVTTGARVKKLSTASGGEHRSHATADAEREQRDGRERRPERRPQQPRRHVVEQRPLALVQTANHVDRQHAGRPNQRSRSGANVAIV